jgi:hypothetical protein
MAPHYYALVYNTITGQVVDEIPMASLPQWNQTINADGSWTITTQIGPDDEGDPANESGLFSKAHLRAVTDTWRHSVAICWGTGQVTDYICQAGPLTARQLVSEQPPILQLGGGGFWPLLRKILQVASTWPGTALTAAGGADTSYTSSMQGVAVDILTNAIARAGLPLDIPAAIAGTVVRQYFGYDLTSSGQRLQELTQVMGGPDILLKPRFTAPGTIRHQALIGNPALATSGNPLVFDYPGNIESILPTDNGVNLSTTTYEKGNGVEYATLWAPSTDPTLPNAGWPPLENVDTSNSGETSQTVLQQAADGVQALNGRNVSTWAVVAKQDDPEFPFGSYDPGVTGVYNLVKHCWLPDGQYTQRILGFQNGTAVNQFVHLLQTTED